MLTHYGATLRRWRRRVSRPNWIIQALGLPIKSEASHEPGLLLIQIDGLSDQQFDRALSNRRLPFIKKLLHKRGYKKHVFYSGMPASTPGVQGELHYGVRSAVPAFSFYDPNARSIGSMTSPSWAKRVESELAAQSEGLLKGGSSWSNIYTGGASLEDSHFCAASSGMGDIWKSVRLRAISLIALLHLPSLVRLFTLIPIELGLSIIDAFKGISRGKPAKQELKFILARIFVTIGLREVVTIGVKVDLARGVPIIHANLLGYDEQSHRRGPDSRFAHWTLKGIDRTVRNLSKAARRSESRDYEVWVFSDHGQIGTTFFGDICKGGLQGALARSWPHKHETQPARSHDVSRAAWLRNKSSLKDHENTRENGKNPPAFEVACKGPVGHIYFGNDLNSEETTRLVQSLIKEGIPGILEKKKSTVFWHTTDGSFDLGKDQSLLNLPDKLNFIVARDLIHLTGHRGAGDLIALGWHPKKPPVSFANEQGGHCGPSPEETQGFLLVSPAQEHLVSANYVRPCELRDAALQYLGRKNHTAQASLTIPTSKVSLRVMTYNVHYCKGLDGRFSPDRIARVIRSVNPDIVALQELESGRARSRFEDQLQFLAESLNMDCCFCPTIDDAEQKYGHAFLSKFPIRLEKIERLPDGGRPRIEPRDAMAASVKWNETAISLFGTHLGLAVRERIDQINLLGTPRWLGGIKISQPAIFMGDLNLSPGGSLYRRLTALFDNGPEPILKDALLKSATTHSCKTFPSFLPIRRLDHIFVSAHFDVRQVFTISNQLTRLASDHLPLVTNLVYNPTHIDHEEEASPEQLNQLPRKITDNSLVEGDTSA